MHTPLSSVASLIGWARKYRLILLALVLTLSMAGSAGATTYNVSINAADIVAGIHASGDYLHGVYSGSSLPTGESRWGLTGLYILPDIDGGAYTLSSLGTSAANWGASLPGSPFGSYAAGKYAYFNYNFNWQNTEYGMITDKPLSDFPLTYSQNNQISLVQLADSATFSFAVTTNSAWSGDYYFLVDGIKYKLSEAGNTYGNPYGFTAGSIDYGGLSQNYTNGQHLGYASVPIPGSLLLLGSGLIGLVGLRGWRKLS